MPPPDCATHSVAALGGSAALSCLIHARQGSSGIRAMKGTGLA
jgi:hypothetical protein